MSEYQDVLSAASQLPIDDRLRLIDDLASSVPDDQPPTLSKTWLEEINRRSADIESGKVSVEPWQDVRQRLFDKHGVDSAD